MAELTSAGLSIDRFPDILTGIEEAEKTNINPNIYTRDDELLGQLNNILAERESLVQELIQTVYDSQIIDNAEDKNLDDLAALRNVTRISESSSSTDSQTFTGDNGTEIPAGSVFSNLTTGDTFSNPNIISLQTSNSLETTYQVSNILNSTDYVISVNGVDYTYASDVDATANEIVLGLAALITADLSATWSATTGTNTITITSDDDLIDISAISYLIPTEVITEGRLVCTTTGSIAVPANSVTNIVSSVVGLTSTTNPDPYILGRSEETDEELRLRIKTNSGGDSTGTIPSIENALLNNVAGITSAIVIENATELTDVDGRPPHSYETIVVGGDNTEVANEVWRTKPAGIALFGNTTEVIVDSNGNNRTIKFTRPTVVNFAVNVEYTLYTEESFPATGEDAIKAAVVDYINSLLLDEDVIPSRIFGPIYNAVEGIEELIVEIQTIATPGDAPIGGSWQTTKIAIDDNEYANTTLVDVYVAEI